MDSDSWLYLLSLLALILAGGFFAAVETGYSASNTIRIRTRAENGDLRAKAALRMLDNYDRALTTLLVANNITHIATASLATLLVTRLWGVGSVAYATIVTTVVVFFAAEMLPKSFAMDHPEQVALATARAMRTLVWVFSPLTALFMGLNRLLTALFDKPGAPSVTEEELYDIIETITEEGTLEESKKKLITSALEFDHITVDEILTARVSLVGVELEAPYPEVLEIVRNNKFSRLPVYRDTMDDIVGVLGVRRLIKSYLAHGESVPLSSLMDSPYFVHRKKRIDDLLSEMSAKRMHMAVVTDDYGGTLGIVTMEDILEELVGEIWDEDDEVREDFKAIGGNRFEVSGDLFLHDAFDLMDYHDIPRDKVDHKTMGAWALEHLNVIPQQGSGFVFGRLSVTVQQMSNNRRITKLLLKLEDKEA